MTIQLSYNDRRQVLLQGGGHLKALSASPPFLPRLYLACLVQHVLLLFQQDILDEAGDRRLVVVALEHHANDVIWRYLPQCLLYASSLQQPPSTMEGGVERVVFWGLAVSALRAPHLSHPLEVRAEQFICSVSICVQLNIYF